VKRAADRRKVTAKSSARRSQTEGISGSGRWSPAEIRRRQLRTKGASGCVKDCRRSPAGLPGCYAPTSCRDLERNQMVPDLLLAALNIVVEGISALVHHRRHGCGLPGNAQWCDARIRTEPRRRGPYCGSCSFNLLLPAGPGDARRFRRPQAIPQIPGRGRRRWQSQSRARL
jgi:hypothetical protein